MRHEKLKRIIAITLLGLMTVSCLAGCGDKKSASNNASNIKVEVQKEEPKSEYKLFEKGDTIDVPLFLSKGENISYDEPEKWDENYVPEYFTKQICYVTVPKECDLHGSISFIDYMGNEYSSLDTDEDKVYEIETNEMANGYITEIGAYDNHDNGIHYSTKNYANYEKDLESAKKLYDEVFEFNDTNNKAFAYRRDSDRIVMEIYADDKCSITCHYSGVLTSKLDLDLQEVGYAIYDTVKIAISDEIHFEDEYKKEDTKECKDVVYEDYGPSESLADGKFSIDDKNFKLGCTVKELETSGYILNPIMRNWKMVPTDEYHINAHPAYFVDDKNDFAFMVKLENPTDETIDYLDSHVISISVIDDDFRKAFGCDLRVANDLGVDNTKEELSNLAGEQDYISVEKDKVYISVDGEVDYWFEADYKDGKMKSLIYAID